MKRLIKKIWRYMKWVQEEKIRKEIKNNSAEGLRGKKK